MFITAVSSVLAFFVGFGLAYGLRGTQARDARILAEQLFKRIEEQRKAYETRLIEIMKGNFSELALDALSKSEERFMALAEQRLSRQSSMHSLVQDHRTRCEREAMKRALSA
jgi:hypothetical protein